MHFSTLAVAVLPMLALAAPLTASSERQSPPTNDDINSAMFAWLQDTGYVSSYLDYAVSLLPSVPSDLQYQGSLALNAENDELFHKSVLDMAFADNPTVVAASNVLMSGTFLSVVNNLQDISTTGNLDAVRLINKNRCASVLPAIDVYFAAVAQLTGVPTYAAIRPLACGGQ